MLGLPNEILAHDTLEHKVISNAEFPVIDSKQKTDFAFADLMMT